MSVDGGVSLDSLDSIRLINDRFAIGEALRCLHISAGSSCSVRSIPHVLMSDGSITSGVMDDSWWPVVVKPRVADGSEEAHTLFVAWGKEALPREGEWRVEPYVEHEGIVVKTYVLGGEVTQMQRPSLPKGWLQQQQQKNANAMSLKLDRETMKKATMGAKVAVNTSDAAGKVETELLQEAVGAIRSRLGNVHMMGLDLVWDAQRETYWLIDVNYMPGYYGVSMVFHKMAALAYEKVTKMRATAAPTTSTTTNSTVHNVVVSQHSSPLLVLSNHVALFAHLCGMYLSPKDVARLACTCRILRDFVSSGRPWEQMCYRRIWPPQSASCIRQLVQSLRSQHDNNWTLMARSFLSPHRWDVNPPQCMVKSIDSPLSLRCISPLSPLRPYCTLRLLSTKGRYSGIGLSPSSCPSPPPSLWLPPSGALCWVSESGLWLRGSRLDFPSLPSLSCKESHLVTICVEWTEGAKALSRCHFWLDHSYCFTVAPETPLPCTQDWHVAVQTQAGEAQLINMEPPVLPPQQNWQILV